MYEKPVFLKEQPLNKQFVNLLTTNKLQIGYCTRTRVA